MTKNLQGRTDNTIKNHWNSGMRRKIPELMERLAKIKQSTIEFGCEILESIQCEVEKDLLKQLAIKNENEDDLNKQIMKSRKGRKPAIINQNNNSLILRNVTIAQLNKKKEKEEQKLDQNNKKISKKLSNSALKELAESKLQERLQKKQFQVNLKNSAFSPYNSNKKINLTYSPQFPALGDLQRTAQKLFSQLISPLTHSKNKNMLSLLEEEKNEEEDDQKQLRDNNFLINQKSTTNLYNERQVYNNYESPSKMLNLMTPKEKRERIQNKQKENIVIKSPINIQKKLLFQCEQADSFFAQEN